MARTRTLGIKLKAIDKMSATISRISKKFPKLSRNVRRASRTFQIFNAQTKSMRTAFRKIGGGMQRFGRSLATFVTLPLLAAAAASVKFFADFEQGLRGIEKTTGLARPAVAALGREFDQLSTEMPVTTAEMLELAKAGGQLGVTGVDNIRKFTITMAKLGRATDVAGEEGAKSIARILTVTGDGIGKIDRFSAALVELGNNAAAGEQEILQVALRVAGQIGRFDVASDKVLGISTALKALGKNAESAGSVVGRSFDAIDQAIRGGGRQMQLLSKLTGIAGKDLKQAFEKDAAIVFQKFVEGLNKVGKGGGNMIKVLSFLGLQGVRINDILGTLAKKPEVLAENMERASKAFEKNTALQKEFEIQTDSLGSELIILKNTFVSLLTLIGEELAPVVKFFGKIIKGILDFLRNNPTIRTFVIILGALLTVLGPILIIFGAILVILPALIAGFAAIGVTTIAATLPFILMGAAVLGVIAILSLIIAKWDELNSFFDQNPFLSFIKSILFLITPIGQVLTGINLLVSAFSRLNAVKNTFKGNLPKFTSDTALGPSGASLGAANKGKGLAGVQNIERTNNASVKVDFLNAPFGTKISSTVDDLSSLNLGFAGGIQ